MGPGRKSKYETHVQPYLDKIPLWYETMTEAEIAKMLGVSVSSFEKYKTQHEELTDKLKFGKVNLITECKNALKRRALGFHYTESKEIVRDGIVTTEKHTRYCPPDVGAAHLLLKNLDDNWRNDDKPTQDLKKQKVDMEQKRTDREVW